MPLFKGKVLSSKPRKLPQLKSPANTKKPAKPSSGKKSRSTSKDSSKRGSSGSAKRGRTGSKDSKKGCFSGRKKRGSTSRSPGKRERRFGVGKKAGTKPKGTGKRGSSGSGKRGRSASSGSEKRCFGRRKKSRSTSKGKRGSTGSGKKGSKKRDSTGSGKRGRSGSKSSGKRCFSRKKKSRSGSKGSGKRGSKGRSSSKDSGKRGPKGRSGAKGSGKRGSKGRSSSQSSGKRCFGRRSRKRSTSKGSGKRGSKGSAKKGGSGKRGSKGSAKKGGSGKRGSKGRSGSKDSGKRGSKSRGRSCFGRRKKRGSTSGTRGSAGRGKKGRSSSKGSGKGRSRSSSKGSKKSTKKKVDNTWFSFREAKKGKGGRKGRSTSKGSGKGGRKGSKGSGKGSSKDSGKRGRKRSKGSSKKGRKGSGKRGSKGSGKKGRKVSKGSRKRGRKKSILPCFRKKSCLPSFRKKVRSTSRPERREETVRRHRRKYGKTNWIGLARVWGTRLRNIPARFGAVVKEFLPDKNDLREFARNELPFMGKGDREPKRKIRRNSDRLHEAMGYIYTLMKYTLLLTFTINRRGNCYFITVRRVSFWHIVCATSAALYCYLFYLYSSSFLELYYKRFEYLDAQRLKPIQCAPNWKFDFGDKWIKGRKIRSITPVWKNFTNWMDNDACVWEYSMLIDQHLMFENMAEVLIVGITYFQAAMASVHLIVYAKHFAALTQLCYTVSNMVNIVPKRKQMKNWLKKYVYYVFLYILGLAFINYIGEYCFYTAMIHRGTDIHTMLLTRHFFFYFGWPYLRPNGQPYYIGWGWLGTCFYLIALITARVHLLYYLVMCRIYRDFSHVWNIRFEYAMDGSEDKEKPMGRRGVRLTFGKVMNDHSPIYTVGDEIGKVFGYPIVIYYYLQTITLGVELAYVLFYTIGPRKPKGYVLGTSVRVSVYPGIIWSLSIRFLITFFNFMDITFRASDDSDVGGDSWESLKFYVLDEKTKEDEERFVQSMWWCDTIHAPVAITMKGGMTLARDTTSGMWALLAGYFLVFLQMFMEWQKLERIDEWDLEVQGKCKVNNETILLGECL